MFAKQLLINHTWDGKPIGSTAYISLFFRLDSNELKLMVKAPFYNDVPPDSSPGSTPGLWEYEVVELFLLGAADQYLEIELGPHGHYLIYLLSGVRVVERTIVPLSVACSISGTFWQGEITIDRADLPAEISHVNGYGLHGQGGERCYLAAAPVIGATPDFHQPEFFLPLDGLADWHPSEVQ